MVNTILDQWRCSFVSALTQFFINHVNTITVILNHIQVVDNGFHVFFFLHLLINKPLQHALCGIVVFCRGERKQFVDAFGDRLLVTQ